MPTRNIKFYSELVLVTVLSLIAANAWVRLLMGSLQRFFPNSLTADFFAAVVMTFVAVVVLHLIFSKQNTMHTHTHERESAYEDEKGEVIHKRLYYE